ncbi:tigger transposable element-derived protein 6-like [Metopolophium dirhodum]|uniref:tigger transposable element-derived protein 6-like n=1 Tax=Metopolophium dirhodum TaxID=44670 RepID=UPI00298FE86B|nr:tigger transposable element-derived protein 6-like [Metopolophium dirhodum]
MSSKLKCLSISDKKKIIEEIESGKKKKEVVDSFKIPFSSLSTILKQKEVILNTTDAQSSRKKKRLCEFPRIEQCLFTWFNQVRQQNIPVSGILIKEKAKSYAKMFGISDFNACDGWLSNFKKPHNLVFKKICGESASVDEDICNDWQMKLQDLLCEYDPKNVFNADETGLFFKCLPVRTLTFKNEKCHGGKLSKERVTLLFAEIVSEFLACLDNNDSPKVTVLTAIIISHKDWNNVTTQTIRNCFRKCGFVKTIDNEEEEFPITLEVDTQHNTLSTVLNNQLTFEDYVAIDDDLAVCGSLTDDEIFVSFNNEEGYDEENDEEESPEDPIVNSKEAKLGLRAVLSYLQRHDIDDNVFSSILNLDNTIDKIRKAGRASTCSTAAQDVTSPLRSVNVEL